MKMVIELEFEFGEVVYQRVNSCRDPGIVTTMMININKSKTYGVSFGSRHTYHFAEELTREFIPTYEE